MTTTVQVLSRGMVTLPTSLRGKHDMLVQAIASQQVIIQTECDLSE